MSVDPNTISSCFGINGVSCYGIAKDFIPPLATLLAGGLAIWFGFRQIKKQKNIDAESKRIDIERSIKLDLFKEVNNLIGMCSSNISSIRSSLIIKKIMKQNLLPEEIIHTNKNISDAILLLVLKLESYEVINPKLFRVFRYAMLSIHHDLLNLQRGKHASDPGLIYDCTEDVTSYIADLQVSLQNMTYSEIFGNTVEYRVPVSDRYKVIVDDSSKLDSLEYFLLNETEWGRDCNRVEQEVFEDEHFPETENIK
jgi:hypothetical protein